MEIMFSGTKISTWMHKVEFLNPLLQFRSRSLFDRGIDEPSEKSEVHSHSLPQFLAADLNEKCSFRNEEHPVNAIC